MINICLDRDTRGFNCDKSNEAHLPHYYLQMSCKLDRHGSSSFVSRSDRRDVGDVVCSSTRICAKSNGKDRDMAPINPTTV